MLACRKTLTLLLERDTNRIILMQSANNVDSHHVWIKDIDEVNGSKLTFPIIADADRKIAYLYDMLDYDDITNVDQKGKLIVTFE